MRLSHLACFFSSILVVLGGNCLSDWNTAQASSAWNTRLWSYSPKSASAASTSATLSFLSYNLQSSISDSCVSNPQAQASFMNTDFVGMQEVVQGVDTRCNCNMPQIIADSTGKSTRFAMTFPWRTGQYGVALGTSQAILDTKYYLYNYANAEQRAFVAVKTKPSGLNGNALWFISTHLEYTVWAARQSQASQLIQWVRDNIISQDSTASVVVVGDFNGGPDDQMYGTLKGLFKNAWEVYTGSASGGLSYPSAWPGSRFDHIWYYTPASVSAQLTSVEVINTQASDHRPVKAVIKFTTASSTSAPVTKAPVTSAPATPAPSTKAPVTSAPATPAPATPAPSTKAPVTSAPVTATPAPATKAPVTSAPVTTTPAPSTKAPVTSAPVTSAPAKGATSAPTPSGCSVSVSYNALGNNIVLTNTGTKALKAVELTFSPSLPSNNWNLMATSTSNVFSLPVWAYPLGAGATYTSSGFYTPGDKPTITATRVSC